MPKNLGANATTWLKTAEPEPVVGYLLKTLHHGLRRTLNDALRGRVGLSFPQGAALFELYFEPGLTGAQLARRALVSAQTMNSMLRNLETLGFIERRPHPESRRADSWFPTERGAEEVRQARVIGDAVFRRMLASFTSEEVSTLQDYLHRCIDAIEGDGREHIVVKGAPRSATARPRRRVARRAAAR